MALLLAGLGMIAPAGAASPTTITSGDSFKHAVALIFDDGPSPVYTPQVLALLEQYQAKDHLLCVGLQGGALSRCG